MTTQTSLPAKFEGTEYVRLENASPYLGNAVFFRHPTHGWVRALDTVTDIELDIVVAAFGDPVTGEFQGLHKAWYPDSEELIVPIDEGFVRDRIQDTPDEVHPADSLVTDLQSENAQP